MYNNYPYLKNYVFLQSINKMKLKQQFIKIIVLNWNEEAIQDISGIIIDGNININGDSAMRRTASINLFAADNTNDLTNVDNLISINKKVEILIGIKNTTDKYLDYPIIWLPQGIYLINAANISHGLDGVKISVTLHDKMAQLNGECGGIIPATTVLDEIEEEDEFGNITISKPTVVQIIQQVVNHFGNEKLGKIIIKDLEPTIKQVLKWNGNTNTPLYIYNNGDQSSASLNQYSLYKQIFTNLYVKYRQENNDTIDTATAKAQAATAFQNLILAIDNNAGNVEIEILQSFIIKLKNLQKEAENQKENFQKLKTQQEELKSQLKKRYRSLIAETRRSLQNLKMNIKQVHDLHKQENKIDTILSEDEQTMLKKTSKDLRKVGVTSLLLKKVRNLKTHLQTLKRVAHVETNKNDNILKGSWTGADGKKYNLSIENSPKNALAAALSLPHPAQGNGPNYKNFFDTIVLPDKNNFNRYSFRFPYSESSYISVSENKKGRDTSSGLAMITSGGKSAADKKAEATNKNEEFKNDTESRLLFTPNVKTLSLCAFNLNNINYETLDLNYFFCFGEFLIIRKYFVNNENKLKYLPVSYLKLLEAIQKKLSYKIDAFRSAVGICNDYSTVVNFLNIYIEWCDNIEQFLNAFYEIEKKMIDAIKNSKSSLLNSITYCFKNNFYTDIRKSTDEKAQNKNLSFFDMLKQQLQQLKNIVDLLQYKETDTNNNIITLRENSQKIYEDIKTKIDNLKTNLRQLSFNNSQSSEKIIYLYKLNNQNFSTNEKTLWELLSNILITVYNFLQKNILDKTEKEEKNQGYQYRNTLKICSDSTIQIQNNKNIQNTLESIENSLEAEKKYNETIIKNSLSEITSWFITKAKTTGQIRLLSTNDIKDFNQSHNTYYQGLKDITENLKKIKVLTNTNGQSKTIANTINKDITETISYMQNVAVKTEIETYQKKAQNLKNQLSEYLPTESFMDNLIETQESKASTMEQLNTSILEYEERLKNLIRQYDVDFIKIFKEQTKDKEKFRNAYWNSKITYLIGDIKINFFNQFINAINKIKSYTNGEDIGYTLTDFIYPGKLTANAGETVVSVLDKIKNTLGNFEYFYDIHGNFIFQEIKNYLNTSYSSYFLDNNTSPNYNYNLVDGKICYDFSDGEIIQSYQNAPQYNKIKNDFIVWGERKSTNGQKYPIHYHLSIDTQPEIGQIYCYTFPTITGVNRFNEDKNSTKQYRTVRKPSSNKEKRDFVPEGKIIDNKNTYFYKSDLPSKGVEDTYYYVKSENQFYEWVKEKNSTFYGYKTISVPTTNIQSFLTRKELYKYKEDFDGKTLTKNILKDYNFYQLSTNDLYNNKITVTSIIQELIENCVFIPSTKISWATSSSTPHAQKVETKIYRYKYWFYTEDTDQYYYFYIQKNSNNTWVGHFTYQWFPRIKKCTIINSTKDISTIKYDTYYYNTEDKYIYRAITNSQTKQPELQKTLLTPFSVSDYRMALFLNGAVTESYNINETNDYYTELKNQLPKLYNILPQKATATSKLSTAYYFTTIQNNPTNMDYYLDILNDSDLVSKYGITNIGKRTQIINNNNINCIFQPSCPNIFYLNKNKPVSLNQSIQNQKIEENANKEERIKLRNLYKKWNKKHILTPFSTKIEVDNLIYENFVNGGALRSAYEEIRSMLYDYITYNEQVTLSVLPIYYLEPNSLIKVHDETAHIIGDFMIKSISYSLAGNGLMNLSCTKALTRI